MMTILHLIETSGPGGAEKMLISLAERLDSRRYRSVVCLLKDGWLNRELRDRGIETIIRPQHRSYDATWLYQLVELLRDRAVGLMHTHEFTMNAYGAMASAVTGVPIVSTVHGKNYYADRWRRRVAYRALARRATLVAVSDDIRRFLASRVGVPYSRVTTVHNGIDPEKYRPNEDARDAVRRRLNLGDRPVIGAVGNLYPVKGHRYLLQAAALVKAVCPEAMFLVAGRGPLLAPLQTAVSELGLGRNVAFLGFEQDIHALLQCFDVFALPSLSEGLSLSVLEAMAAAKPVVATSVGGNPEVIVDGETGYLVPPEDPEALAAQILHLLGDPTLRRHFGERGRQRVERAFTLSGMVQRYQRIYDEQLEGAGMSRQELYDPCEQVSVAGER